MLLFIDGNKGIIFACYHKLYKGFIMDVGASGSTQQMQMQTQMRKMDGSGGGQGNGGGMKDVMQNLSTEDQATLKDQMSSMSQADKTAMVDQMKQVDATSMSTEDYSQTLLDMVNEEETSGTTSSPAYSFSAYA
jgi:pantothenate kinase